MIATKVDYSEFGAGIIESTVKAKKSKHRRVTYVTRFETNNEESLKQLWNQFKVNGKLDNSEDNTPSKSGVSIGSALCVSDIVHPGDTISITFSLVWDVPIARFNSGNGYFRRYTRFLGREGDNADKIATTALRDYPKWINAIHNWQKPILENPDLPDSYKMVLFNELYFIVDGGTVWTDGQVDDTDIPDLEIMPRNPDDIGKFFYLEGHEYLMCNTYDVHFYASYALAMLWPEIELSIQRDFAEATSRSLSIDHFIIGPNLTTTRKKKWAVPHDLGNPGEDPWNLPNSYNLQEIDKWKDLNCKFVLQIYRDYVASKNRQFLEEMWPIVKKVIHYSKKNFDRNDDSMIENEGFPDQTYDTWSVTGCSAYCGGLWVATLKVARRIAYDLDDTQNFVFYTKLYKKARQVYQALWNGQFFHFDHHNTGVVQSDQMAGNWYSVSCGIGGIVPLAQAQSCLSTIYRLNVCGFQNGQVGAVNGVLLDGSPDTTCIQSSEVWTGVTFAVAAAMLQVGLVRECFQTLHGICDASYNRWGYAFDTPEAWSIDGKYRSKGYMRPLSVWAVQWMLDHKEFSADDEFDKNLEKEMNQRISAMFQEGKEKREEETSQNYRNSLKTSPSTQINQAPVQESTSTSSNQEKSQEEKPSSQIPQIILAPVQESIPTSSNQ